MGQIISKIEQQGAVPGEGGAGEHVGGCYRDHQWAGCPGGSADGAKISLDNVLPLEASS